MAAGLRVYGTASADDRAAVERLGAVAIDYQHEDFLARVRELTGDGVDIALDPFGGAMSLRSFRALRAGGKTCHLRPPEHHRARAQELAGGVRVVRGHRDRRAVGTAIASATGARLPDPKATHPPPRLVSGGFPRAARAAGEGNIHPVVAERLPLSKARRAHEMLERTAARENSSRALGDRTL